MKIQINIEHAKASLMQNEALLNGKLLKYSKSNINTLSNILIDLWSINQIYGTDHWGRFIQKNVGEDLDVLMDTNDLPGNVIHHYGQLVKEMDFANRVLFKSVLKKSFNL